MTQLPIDKAGRIALPARLAGELGEAVRLLSRTRHHLLLAPECAAEDVLLAGCLGEVSVADLLSFLNMFRKSGVLVFSLPGGVKELVFTQGEIVAAVTTFPEEDLGEQLHALGKVDRDTLGKARQLGGATDDGVKRWLLENGVVTPKDVWAAGRAQVEAIVYSLLPSPSGSYALLRSSGLADDLPHFSVSTQTLIMEGLRRADEHGLFLERLGSLDTCPQATGKSCTELPPSAQRILSLVGEGRMPIREVLRRSALGEFEGLRLLYQLHEQGLISVNQPPAVTVPPLLAEVTTIYNGALATLGRRIGSQNHEFNVELRRFLRDLPQPYSFVLRDVSPAADGTFETARLVANLAGLDENDQLRLIVDALNEVLFMFCVAARRDLGEAASAEMVQRVQEIGRRVKLMIGRNNG